MKDKEIRRRSISILALASLFLISGVAFFFTRMDISETGAGTPQQIRYVLEDDAGRNREKDASALLLMPGPETYAEFSYASGTPLTVDGLCKDEYYTVLIYPKGVDYRTDTLGAVYNVAEACGEKTAFLKQIPLETLRLAPGRAYYVIRAHQGKEGSWYDPY